MYDINLPRSDLTPYFRRAHVERAQAAANLLRATVRVVGDWATAIAAARTRRRVRRETVRQLAGLSDRTLRDIGIPRGAIWSVADDLVNAAAGTAATDREPPQPAWPAPTPANQNRRPTGRPLPLPLAVGCG